MSVLVGTKVTELRLDLLREAHNRTLLTDKFITK